MHGKNSLSICAVIGTEDGGKDKGEQDLRG
jgi:hypothetical protein